MIEATNPHYTSLPLAQVEPSPTNPRKHFDLTKLQELADSIKASGIHQPILVRPLPGHRVADTAWEPGSLRPRAIKPTHEIVAGERRYRAAKLAGLAEVPVIVKHMTDAEVLEAQILENLQREDLTPLEEAEGYQTLIDRTGISADQVGAKVGKSRSYVYGRLKLLDLATAGRDALRAGEIDASVALLLARIPDTGLQAKALANLVDYHGNGEHISARDAAHLIRRSYMLDLARAPFDIKAPALTAAGPCNACPKRTGANPDLFSDVKGSDLCTDPTCHAAKVTAHQAATMAKAHERGITVIEGREAKALMPHPWAHRVDGYRRLDHKDDSPTGVPLRKVLAKAMAQAGVKEKLLANPHVDGELIAVLTTEQVTELLALATQLDAKAAPAAKAMAEQTEAQRKAERAEVAQERVNEFESAWRWAVLEEVWAEASKAAERDSVILKSMLNGTPAPDGHGLKRHFAIDGYDPLARHIATRFASGLNTDRAKRLGKLLKLEKVAPVDTLKSHVSAHPNPTALLWLLVAEADVEYRNWLPAQDENAGLMLAAEAFGVNVDAVQKAVKDELKEKHFAEDQKALLPLPPAAQASGGRGEKVNETKPGRNPDTRKSISKGPAARARDAAPKTTAAEAEAGIAAAFAEVDAALAATEDTTQRAAPEGIEAAPLAATPAPADAAAPQTHDQRPAAEGIEAAPLAAPTAPQPVHTPAPATGNPPHTNGPASPALGLGVRVRVLPSASGVKQAGRIGQEGVIDRQTGPEAWDVRFAGTKSRAVPQRVCYHVSELEVVA